MILGVVYQYHFAPVFGFTLVSCCMTGCIHSCKIAERGTGRLRGTQILVGQAPVPVKHNSIERMLKRIYKIKQVDNARFRNITRISNL
jgi:hypothetical protein